MFEFLFLILFILFPFLIILLYKFLLQEKILKVGILNFLLINIFMFAYLGVVFLFFHIDPLRVENGVVDQEIIFKIWFFSSLSVIFIILGAFFAKKSLHIKDVSFNTMNIQKNSKIQRYKAYFFIFIGLLVLGLYIKQVPDLAIFNIFSFDDKNKLRVLRSDMGNNFKGSYFLYTIFMKDVLQFLIFAFYTQWLVFKEKRDLYIVLFLFFVNSFVALMAIEKAPIIWLIAGLFLVNILVKSKGLIPIKSIIKITIPSFAILICMYMLFMKSLSISDAFNSVLSRAFTGSITPAYFYLDLFPEYHDYLYGKSFPNPMGILPYEPVRLTVMVMDWVNPELEQLGIVGTMPTVFWAEIYANFGPVLIAPVAFFVGFILKLLDGLIMRFRLLPLSIGYYVWVILYFKNLSVTSFSNYTLNIPLIIVTMVFIFVSTSNFKIHYIR
ncbi:hypothetical protein L292_2026 [Acinetobacter junii CIP 107470 = MTCC 11364]|uniref:Oligosaccharide repeat unit polymerase n=1 Tax=Acinetobacter junii CIP 107470 = MTCC 11364 TaxID=1217666 RepID=S7Y701_ACIJU|nr:O-antigen polymerase [Acinetobacter junii]ENV52138.1 hypothetical protein F953_00419 [Acinetobacter junii CIP 107470 = MTCC 11364]EPR86954.1 hypothetical protein L292_2026 [Acinetobacter junii CIP 107470 = MTCC 11364]